MAGQRLAPYRHQASLRGVGCDCLGLLRGLWRELYGPEPENFEPYTSDWGEVSHEETLLVAARRHLVMGDPSPEGFSAPLVAGEIAVFRMRAQAIAKHVAVISSTDKIIHAQEGCGVVEVPIGPWWRRRIAGRFSLPERTA